MAITTNTTETARAINTEIQRRLDPAGRVPRRHLADGTHISVDHQIATRRNDPALRTDRGEKVRNRHTWTVTALDTTGGTVATHPNRGTVTLPALYVASHVELGWAVTGYGNQGDTPSTSASPSSNRAPPATTPMSPSPEDGPPTGPGSPTPPAPSTPPTPSPP